MRSALPTPTPETFTIGKAARRENFDCSAAHRALTCTSHARLRPKCSSRDVAVFAAAGRGTLYSYIINHRPRPDMGSEPPRSGCATR